jgi:hypothetical protein
VTVISTFHESESKMSSDVGSNLPQPDESAEAWALPDDTVSDDVKNLFDEEPNDPGEDGESTEDETDDAPEDSDDGETETEDDGLDNDETDSDDTEDDGQEESLPVIPEAVRKPPVRRRRGS